ncbi:MAG TPA: SDR family NAD(P)-dependent oxidoreductase [Mycobacterium sp.]|nr:SDR family NAD(P)-dependent oxidoreductase [Mycobacterium sp.]
MSVTFDFTGRVALVTGATGGIGRAIAHLFSDSGADLILADIGTEQLDSLAAELRGNGKVVVHRYDATDRDGPKQLAERARDAFGGVDIVVPSAGIYPTDAVAEMEPETLDRVLQINLTSVAMLIRQCIPLLRQGSSIVTLSSVAAHRGSINHAHYAMSKAGILALTRSLAGELAPRTRANAVSPGTIDTPMARPNIEAMGDRILAATPLNRFGTAEEVAATVAFLASDAAGFIDGENIHVNGGWYIG